MKYLISFLGYGVLFLVLIVGLVLLHGWAISVLWGWFIVPVFSAPALSYLQAYGLAIFVALFKDDLIVDNKGQDPKKKLIYQIILGISKPIFSVFLGWILLQFM